MPIKPKFPPGCAHLDLKEVERVLTKHRADITAAAKELGVSRTDLRRLTWHDPKLLEEGLFLCWAHVSRCNDVIISAIYSNNRRKREWACDKILSTGMAGNHPFATAVRAVSRWPKQALSEEKRALFERLRQARRQQARSAQLASHRR